MLVCVTGPASGTGSRRAVSVVVVAVVAIACTGAIAQTPPEAGTPDAGTRNGRLDSLTRQISLLQAELDELHRKERGILGEVERLDAELRLRETEVSKAAVRLEEITAAIDRHDAALAQLEDAQQDRRRYLAFRLREIYKAGSEQLLQRVLAGDELDGYWEGLSYASYLSERDGAVLNEYRGDSLRSEQERTALATTRDELAAVHVELAQRRDSVAAARRKRAAALEGVRRDEGQRRTLLLELQEAADGLSELAETFDASRPAGALDIHRFKGLLDWPADGQLRESFGTVVHPEFKTEIPHPGWDIAAPFGSDIVSVFDGQVVFADWMRGYGLTAIVDHGANVLSIYAHASLLMVQAGERVVRGQTLGKVGETGSLRGAYLYFELRIGGEPADPAAWLRGR